MNMPTITTIVTSYEETIQNNRQNGFDKDLLGYSGNLPSPYRPDRVRKYVESFSKQNNMNADDMLECPAVRRMSLLDAMMAPMLPRESHQDSTSDTKSANKLRKPRQSKQVKQSKEDEEMIELRKRIANLKKTLQQAETDHLRQLQAIKDSKEQRIENILKDREEVVVGENKGLEQQIHENHKLVEELRQSNQNLRQNNCELASMIEDAKEQNAMLEAESKRIEACFCKLEEIHFRETSIHNKLTAALAKYRKKCAEFVFEADRREDWVLMEKNMKHLYCNSLSKIMSEFEDRGIDDTLLEEVIQISRGLDSN